MKDALRTRLEFLWAKLAGRDIDIDTLTPDAPTNMTEKLMLETANRIADAEQSGGGSGVMPITVGENFENVLDDVQREAVTEAATSIGQYVTKSAFIVEGSGPAWEDWLNICEGLSTAIQQNQIPILFMYQGISSLVSWGNDGFQSPVTISDSGIIVESTFSAYLSTTEQGSGCYISVIVRLINAE